MESIVMQFGRIEMIHYKPAIFTKRKNSAFVMYWVRQPLVAIMFALPNIYVMMKDPSPRPICPCEAGEHFHLILAVNGDRVMHKGMSKSIARDTLSAIQT